MEWDILLEGNAPPCSTGELKKKKKKKKKVQCPLDVTRWGALEYSKEEEWTAGEKIKSTFGAGQLYAVTDFIPAWILKGKEKSI